MSQKRRRRGLKLRKERGQKPCSWCGTHSMQRPYCGKACITQAGESE